MFRVDNYNPGKTGKSDITIYLVSPTNTCAQVRVIHYPTEKLFLMQQKKQIELFFFWVPKCFQVFNQPHTKVIFWFYCIKKNPITSNTSARNAANHIPSCARPISECFNLFIPGLDYLFHSKVTGPVR